MLIILSVLSIFATAIGVCPKLFAVEHCPSPAVTCKKTENENEYKCVAFANLPSKEDIPQYAWQVSVGQIVGDAKVHQITIDARHLEAKSLVVTLKVRWPKSPRSCEATVENTINLR
jgi:hypothetical protein